jgi:hypothetical protein
LVLAGGCTRKEGAPPLDPALKATNRPGPAQAGGTKGTLNGTGAVPGVVGVPVRPVTNAVSPGSAQGDAATNAPAPPPEVVAKNQAVIEELLKLAADKKWMEMFPKAMALRQQQLTPEQEEKLLPLWENLQKMVREAGAGALLPKEKE